MNIPVLSLDKEPAFPTPVMEHATDPHRLADVFLKWSGGIDQQGRFTLRFWRGDWWTWNGKHYVKRPQNDITGQITQALKEEFELVARLTGRIRVKVLTNLVNNVLNALRSIVGVDSQIDQPAWLGASESISKEHIALNN